LSAIAVGSFIFAFHHHHAARSFGLPTAWHTEAQSLVLADCKIDKRIGFALNPELAPQDDKHNQYLP
jgi:hypothetical protein